MGMVVEVVLEGMCFRRMGEEDLRDYSVGWVDDQKGSGSDSNECINERSQKGS